MRPELALLAFCLLFVVLVTITFDRFQIGSFKDDAHYIALARSLALGNNYSYANFPETVSIPPRFPIGFPLAIAPMIAIFPNAFWPIRIVALSATLINGLLLFHFWPRWTQSSQWYGAVIAGIYWLLPLGVLYGRVVMSEPLFLTIYLLLVAVVADYQDGNEKWWYWLVMVVLAIALIATRTIGVAIVVGAILSFLSNLRTHRSLPRLIGTVLLLATGTLLIILLLINSNAVFPRRYLRESNARYFRSVLPGDGDMEASTSRDNTEVEGGSVDWVRFTYKLRHHMYSDIPDVILPGSSPLSELIDQRLSLPLVQTALVIGASFLLLLGSLRWLQHTGWHVLWISGLAYAAALVFWSWNTPRLLYAIIPHLWYAFLLGCWILLYRVISWGHGSRAKHYSSSVLSGFVVILVIFWSGFNLYRSPSVERVGDLPSRTTWLKENVSPNQIVMTEYPMVDYLSIQTQTVYWPQTQTTSELQSYLREHNVDYLLMAPEIRWDRLYEPNWSHYLDAWQPVIEELEAQSQIVLSFADDTVNVRVYQVLK